VKLIHTLKLIPLLVVLLGSIANAEDSVQVVVVSDEAMDLHILAMNGDVNAQANLGLMYLGGNGVSQDYKEAVKWLTKAAEQGHAQSQYNLGSMCANGHGLPQDRKEAGKWYTKAAEQGIPQAQHNLGFMYATGDGLPKDYVQAHKWWSLQRKTAILSQEK
jgi:TPR repeat protein